MLQKQNFLRAPRDQISLRVRVSDFLRRRPRWQRAPCAQRDSETNRPGQGRTVCQLIFRRAILASSLALISYLSPASAPRPRRPSEIKKPDVVPCNRALNWGQWGFSITPPDRMIAFTLCKKKINKKNLKTSALFICTPMFHAFWNWKISGLFLVSISLIWNCSTAAVCRKIGACQVNLEHDFILAFYLYIYIHIYRAGIITLRSSPLLPSL